MEGAKSIEALSVCFTAGVIAGTMVPGAARSALPALLMAAASLPFLLREQLPRAKETLSVPLILGSFLLAGMLAAILSVPGIGGSGLLGEVAQKAVQGLRACIGSLPFQGSQTAALLQALLTGDKSGLDPGTVAVFRQSGASHLLALSGLHMGIIYLIFDRCTLVLGHSPIARKIRAGLIVAASGFFTLMTGAGPSIVRAFLFIAISEILRVSGRPRKASRVLCLALLIQLAVSPGSIRTLGFQLSYLALLGIVFLYPHLEKWYPEGSRFNPLRRIWQVSALSISCQVFTAPLVWMRFHSFPQYFLLTNLLAIPITTLFMGTAVLTLALGALGCIPPLLITITDGLGRLLVWVLEVIATIGAA